MTTTRSIILLLQAFIATCLLSSAMTKQYKCRQIIDGGRMKQVCQLICPDGCPDGVCSVSIGQCVCKIGTHVENNKCMQDCHAGCPEHAECISGGNSCRCKTGYRSAEDGKCVPSCSPDCGETKYCAEPDTCLCKDGYLTTKAGCQPICQKGCGEHGRCVAPNKCECLEGYKEGDSSSGFIRCLPVCDMSAPHCENADCVAPGKCECRAGFARKTKNGKCEPICAQGCGEHGRCVAHNKCECLEGYKEDDSSSGFIRCLPVCDMSAPHCENADCVAPGKCECRAGFVRKTKNGKCEPICAQGCGEHGVCVAPERCGCVVGYQRVDAVCVPKCDSPCAANEYCYEPNLCRCVHGYEKQPNTVADNNCTPVCAHDCGINAYCVAPGKCNCYKGYAMQADGNCTPICRRACVGNSTCVAPDICLCNIGFIELRGTCVPEVRAEPKTMEKTCLKEMNLLLVRLHVTCDTGPFVMYLIYGLLMGLLVVCALVTYQGYNNFRRRCRKKPAAQTPVDYVITYQPSSERAEADVANTSQRARPPSYNSLPRKH